MAGALEGCGDGGDDGMADADSVSVGGQTADGTGDGVFCADHHLAVVGHGIFCHLTGGTGQRGNIYGLVAGRLAGLGFARQTVVIVVLRLFSGLYAILALCSFGFAMLWQSKLPAITGPEHFLMSFYRNAIGQMDGRACPSYPVCSLYAAQAVQKHGLLLGSWLAMDRMIHEHDDIQDGNWLIIHGEKRLYDPLSRNDFWLNRKQ